MHCRDLVELSALVAVQGGALIRRGRVSESAVEQYWTASKARLDYWTNALKDYAQYQQSTPEGLTNDGTLLLAWRGVRPVLEEILVSEVLTRVWTGVACISERGNTARRIEPVVRSVYVGHQEARNRALNLLVYGRGFNTQEAVELNRLRRRSERWCDMLLGYVVTSESLEEFAFEPERTREFARDIQEELNRPVSPLGWQLVLSSLRAAFKQGTTEEVLRPALNEQISAAILACFPAGLFDSTGQLQSLWMERINHLTSDTQGMIDDLLGLHASPERQVSAVRQPRF
jgi:hypothetical protein